MSEYTITIHGGDEDEHYLVMGPIPGIGDIIAMETAYQTSDNYQVLDLVVLDVLHDVRFTTPVARSTVWVHCRRMEGKR